MTHNPFHDSEASQVSSLQVSDRMNEGIETLPKILNLVLQSHGDSIKKFINRKLKHTCKNVQFSPQSYHDFG